MNSIWKSFIWILPEMNENYGAGGKLFQYPTYVVFFSHVQSLKKIRKSSEKNLLWIVK